MKCIGQVARDHRERVGAQLLDIAFWSRLSQGTVSRFETAESQPRELDRLLTAYAKVSGIAAGDLLREAITRWEEGGGAVTPELAPFPRPEEELADALEEAAQQAEQPPGTREQERPARARRRRSR